MLAKFASLRSKVFSMSRKSTKSTRDVEKNYPTARFVEKLRRLADALEEGKRFQIAVAGERVSVPADAEISVEHERGKDEVELEFQLKWKL